MARPVDAEALEKKISEWLGQPGNGDYYSGYDAALCAVQDLIADTPTITPPNEWVSVEERLPETRDDYIVFTEDAEVFLCDYIPSVGQWWNGDDLVLNGRITHWMSLPASPDRRPPEGEV